MNHNWVEKRTPFWKFFRVTAILALSILYSCDRKQTQKSASKEMYPDVKIAGAMRDVMWKGELEGKIKLDTISEKEGLFGLGPVSFLQGEIIIRDGVTYVSKVVSDSTMEVQVLEGVSAPFLVSAQVSEWNDIELPSTVKSIQDVETFIDEETQKHKRPFAFLLKGQVSQAKIHIQNLPEGTNVSNPDEAHQGQISYSIGEENVEIVGFFSTQHQGIFTHHDSYLHMHLMTEDESKMGHLDELEIEEMRLYLPHQ